MTRIHDPGDEKRINDIVDEIIEEHAKKVAKQTIRKLTMDEIWIYDALDLYDTVHKHPVTGGLHRQHASDIMGRLNKCSDETLRQMANAGEPGELIGALDNARSCFRRMAQILLARRTRGRRSVLVN